MRRALILLLAFYFVESSIFINEISSRSCYPNVDWIELFNNASTSVSLTSSWCFSALWNPPYTCEFTFGGQVIPGNGYLVLNRTQLGFFLSGFSDSVTLVNSGVLEYRFSFDGIYYGHTWGRYVTSDGIGKHVITRCPTPGTVNSPPLTPGPMYFSKIDWNAATDPYIVISSTETTDSNLFMSFTNTSTNTVTQVPFEVAGLSGVAVANWLFPAGAVLPAGKRVWLVSSSTTNLTTFKTAKNVPVGDVVLQTGVSVPTPIGAYTNTKLKILMKQADPDFWWKFYPILADQVRITPTWPLSYRLSPALFGDDPASWASTPTVTCTTASTCATDPCLTPVCASTCSWTPLNTCCSTPLNAPANLNCSDPAAPATNPPPPGTPPPSSKTSGSSLLSSIVLLCVAVFCARAQR